MLEPKDTIALTLGQRSLTVMRLRGRFIGLINGRYYVNAKSAEAAVGALIRIALCRPQGAGMKKRIADSADLVAAARKTVGDAAQDAPLTDAEQDAIEQVRRDLTRPSSSEITRTARRLAGSN